MTDQLDTAGHTDQQAAAALRDRAGNLAAARATKRPRRHPARGSRIAATGLGLTTMLGIVGAMGYAHGASTPAAAPTSVAPPQVVVVVHRSGTAAGTETTSPTEGVRPAQALTARPTVRPAAPAAQTPAASTRGSH